ncbi:CLAVATA3/ESR-related 40 [Sesbania bispinosa]|nr:CLAVATA3/ESR-related 40 [Sesbania bispinosa]
MANSKQVACLILLVLLFTKLESRSLEAFMERKNIPAAKDSKTQILKESFAKAADKFPNLYDTDRLSPQGPDPKHH